MYASVVFVNMPHQMHASDLDDLITSAEAARIINVSKITIHRAVKAGRLTPLRTPGGHFRFRRADVEALLNAEASA